MIETCLISAAWFLSDPSDSWQYFVLLLDSDYLQLHLEGKLLSHGVKTSILYNQPTHTHWVSKEQYCNRWEWKCTLNTVQCWARKWQIHLSYLKTHLINKSKIDWLLMSHLIHFTVTHVHSFMNTIAPTPTHTHTHNVSVLSVMTTKQNKLSVSCQGV